MVLVHEKSYKVPEAYSSGKALSSATAPATVIMRGRGAQRHYFLQYLVYDRSQIVVEAQLPFSDHTSISHRYFIVSCVQFNKIRLCICS